MILAGAVVMVKGLMPMRYEIRFCLMCASITKQFRADPRFKDGKKSEIPTYAKDADKNIFTRVKWKKSGWGKNVSVGSTISSG